MVKISLSYSTFELAEVQNTNYVKGGCLPTIADADMIPMILPFSFSLAQYFPVLKVLCSLKKVGTSTKRQLDIQRILIGKCFKVGYVFLRNF